MSLHFQYHSFIWLFALLGIACLLYFLYLRWKAGRIRSMGDSRLVSVLMGTYSPGRAHGKFAILSLAMIAGIVTVMHLRKPGDSGGISRKGIDVVLALDVSRSMLATDLAPSRLDRARQFMQKLIDALPNDRIALVLFAGQAYLQMPLTTDHGAASLYVSTASTESVPSQGTLVSEALRRSANAFNAAERRFKAVVLITDGEDHDEGAASTAREMSEEGMMISTVGVGSASGSRIPDPATGGFRKDQYGNEVVSTLNEGLLKEIASATNGVYINLRDSDAAVKAITEQLAQIEKKAFSDKSLVNYRSFYWLFAGLMLLLLLLELFLPETKKVKA